MRHQILLCILACLVATGCQNPSVGSGLFGQTRIPPPATQPPGNSYYPALAAVPQPVLGNPFVNPFATPPPPASQPPLSLAPDLLAPPAMRDDTRTRVTDATPRPGTAAISRSGLSTPSRPAAARSSEEPIRVIASGAPAGALAAVVPLRGMNLTDVSGSRPRLALPASLFASSAVPQDARYPEISRLPNATPEIRAAAVARAGGSVR